jgi:hypothetical protein
MSSSRSCIDCRSVIRYDAPKHVIRCRNCTSNSRNPDSKCVECHGMIGNEAPSHATKCTKCYRSKSRTSDIRKASLASHLKQVYNPPSAPIPRKCLECNSILGADVPLDLKNCYTCIGKQMCHRQCDDCNKPISIDVPLEMKHCYTCIGKRAVTRTLGEPKSSDLAPKVVLKPNINPIPPKSNPTPSTSNLSESQLSNSSGSPSSDLRFNGLSGLNWTDDNIHSLDLGSKAFPDSEFPPISRALGSKTPSGFETESKTPSGFEPESKSPLSSEWTSIHNKGKTKIQVQTRKSCIQCQNPVSADAPSYANRCVDCFKTQSVRRCQRCDGPVPNSAPPHATQCGNCQKERSSSPLTN